MVPIAWDTGVRSKEEKKWELLGREETRDTRKKFECPCRGTLINRCLNIQYTDMFSLSAELCYSQSQMRKTFFLTMDHTSLPSQIVQAQNQGIKTIYVVKSFTVSKAIFKYIILLAFHRVSEVTTCL